MLSLWIWISQLASLGGLWGSYLMKNDELVSICQVYLFLERGSINFTRFTKRSVTPADKDTHQLILLLLQFSLDNPPDKN